MKHIEELPQLLLFCKYCYSGKTEDGEWGGNAVKIREVRNGL
jgi:hypothetical protein